MLRAFRARNYRLYFSGQLVSLVGTWMQNLAQGWLVYRLKPSTLLLGMVGFASQAPVLLLTPFTGVLADRWNRHRMMIVVQVGEMLIAMLMAVLYFTGAIRIGHIVALGMAMGVLNAVDAPNRHAFVVQLVEDRSDLPSAIAMNSAMFNSARIIGPSAAGLIIYWAGEGVCFLLNAVSFLAIIVTLLAMRLPPHSSAPRRRGGIFAEMREGFTYTFGSPPLRLVILHYAWVALGAMSFVTLMPALAKETLRGGADRMGFLMGALGGGAIVSALLMASKRSTTGLRRIAGNASVILGASLLLLSFSRSYSLSLIAMGLAGFGMIAQMTATNTFLQTNIDDDKRARVMAFYLLAFFGTVPLGSLAIGALAKVAGIPLAIRMAGVFSILASLIYFQRFARLRRPPPAPAVDASR